MTMTQMSRSSTDGRMAGDGREDGIVVAWATPVKTKHKRSGGETSQLVKRTASAWERGGHGAAAGEEKRHRRGRSSERERWWGDEDGHVTGGCWPGRLPSMANQPAETRKIGFSATRSTLEGNLAAPRGPV